MERASSTAARQTAHCECDPRARPRSASSARPTPGLVHTPLPRPGSHPNDFTGVRFTSGADRHATAVVQKINFRFLSYSAPCVAAHTDTPIAPYIHRTRKSEVALWLST